jgi:hypothetical protein
MPVSSFSHIVSLGHRCRTALRLREHFSFSTAFPFDWWVTPLAGATAVLRDWDVERLYDPARLIERARPNGGARIIEHADYHLMMPHDFPIDGPGGDVVKDWQDHIPRAKARTGHLMEKFDSLNRPDRRVLFVCELKESEAGDHEGIAALRQTALEHTPQAQTSFLLISPSGVRAEGWRSLQIHDPTRDPWTGTPEIWDGAFETLGYSLEGQEGGGEVASTAHA